MGAGPHITEDHLIEVIERITEGNGMSLKASCEISGFDYTNVVRRIRASETLRELHAQAVAPLPHSPARRRAGPWSPRALHPLLG
jgi:hypothetical protein